MNICWWATELAQVVLTSEGEVHVGQVGFNKPVQPRVAQLDVAFT